MYFPEHKRDLSSQAGSPQDEVVMSFRWGFVHAGVILGSFNADMTCLGQQMPQEIPERQNI